MSLLRRSWSRIVAVTGFATAATIACVMFRRWLSTTRSIRSISRLLADRLEASQHGVRVSMVSTEAQWKALEEELLHEIKRVPFIGLDCEWVTPRPQPGGSKEGCRPHKVALLQLATASGWCVLVRLCKLRSLPARLHAVLGDSDCLKLGVGISDDAKKLREDFGAPVRGWFDIRHLAADHRPEARKLGMAGLASSFLGLRLDKDWRVRASDWEADDLSQRQTLYAANDALVSINIAMQAAYEEVASRQSWLLHSGAPQSVEDLGRAAISLCRDKRGIHFKAKSNSKGAKEKTDKKAKEATENTRPSSKKRQDRENGGKLATRKSPHYHNTLLEAPDGQPLCVCATGKAEWYISKGLGVKVKDDPLTVRLNFEPSGRPEGEAGEYYLTVKANKCVVCGEEESYLKKYVVPHEYRKYFPEVMRDHQSHDVLLMCVNCHQDSNHHDFGLRKELEVECDAPIGTADDVKVRDDFALKQVRSAARALLNSRGNIPAERQRELEAVLKEFYKVDDIDDEVIRKGAFLIATIPNENYSPHGKVVVQHYIERSGEGICALERRWRKHFLDTMRPKFLPPLWSVEHQRERLDYRVAENRINADDYAKATGGGGKQDCPSDK